MDFAASPCGCMVMQPLINPIVMASAPVLISGVTAKFRCTLTDFRCCTQPDIVAAVLCPTPEDLLLGWSENYHMVMSAAYHRLTATNEDLHSANWVGDSSYQACACSYVTMGCIFAHACYAYRSYMHIMSTFGAEV